MSASDTRRAKVLLEEPVGLLDYAIPPELVGLLHIGTAVRVPLGRRETGAYVVALPDTPWPQGTPIRAVIACDTTRPTLPQTILELILFAADYYGAPPGDVLSCALPAMARHAGKKFQLTQDGLIRLNQGGQPASHQVLHALGVAHPKGFTVAALEREAQVTRAQGLALLRRAKARGDVQEVAAQASRGRTEVLYTRITAQAGEHAPTPLTPRQKKAQALLAQMPQDLPLTLAAIRTIDANPAGPLRTLTAAGWLKQSRRVVPNTPYGTAEPAAGQDRPAPTDEQSAALATLIAAMDQNTYAAHLLHGVTGSGKTEIYLQAIAHALDRGQTALVLVPEIALTPQLGERFRSRFGSRVATFHSGLSVAERRDEWLRVAQGDAVIGLGARSALFLPLANLGIIVVDEEHETSFKQDESPRYNARDLAVWRAQAANAVVVLGSATPSLESWHNASLGRYTKISMPSRVHSRPLPEVEILSLAALPRVGSGAFTEKLAEAVQQTLAKDQQVILFLNRRGFAPYVFCRDCGHSFRCEDCEVSLTLHRNRGVIVCHYCGYTAAAPDICTGCHGHRVGAFGLGTEQLEAEVRDLFGDVPLVRLDRDTVRKRSDLEGALGRFKRGEARMLIGTQMVAKGHDFPGVTLVGVLSADASLNFPDFRAAERTFQLLTQVAGRAGRGQLPGRVLIQAYEPEHYAIEAARRHDFAAFVEQELGHRQELGYPPYTYLALVRYEAEDEKAVLAAATEQATAWQTLIGALHPELELLGPAPAPLTRLRGQYRIHLLLKAPTRQWVRKALTLLPKKPGRHAGYAIRRIIDIDPISML